MTLQDSGKLRALIVDDEPACRDSLRLMLSLEGFHVVTAASAAEAVQQAALDPPDVVIIDCILRERSRGLDVLASLRQTIPHLHAVIVSGYPSSSMEAEIRRTPRTVYLPKPFPPAELIAAVRAG
ncbi:MAG: response regulator, partial [Planctomycetota bacterium]